MRLGCFQNPRPIYHAVAIHFSWAWVCEFLIFEIRQDGFILDPQKYILFLEVFSLEVS